MPHRSRATQITRDEWDDYRRRREKHLRLYPNYDTWWRRPSRETAAGVWNLLEPSLEAAGISLDDFLPGRNIRPILLRDNLVDDLRWLTKQALVVVLDVFVSTIDTG